MPKKLMTEEFIEKAKNVHGDKYGYSKVEYIGSHNKVCIVCKEHGEFLQQPNCHLNGRGCPKCGILSQIKAQSLTIRSFIEKAKIVHSNKYNYSKVEYVGNKTKVCIICPVHGEFWQRPDEHLKGKGCSKCYDLKRGYTLRCTKEEFINKSIQIHTNKYDYSKVDYINNHKKVIIICPVHGEFWQIPSTHLSGIGCSKCSGKYQPTTEEFIEKAKLIHGNKYDYRKVNYINARTKVCIICKEHGEFWQIPLDHLNGCGCPICNESKLEIEVAKLLDENNILYERQKHFKWLGRQSLDFYLQLYGIGIECQGEQHFKSIDYFGGEDGFIKTIKRDERKFNLCKNNNIEIIYYTNVTIPEDYKKYVYTDKEELIKKVCLTNINN